MGLEQYNQKRHFQETPEPEGEKVARQGSLVFVVQRHQASTLHYDFRLEMEGVLKSWAVPKGPSLNPKDKRLAVQVEDHPYSYRTFEGQIPEGNYGAGTVEIWDQGTYRPVGELTQEEGEMELLAGVEKGRLNFILHGQKLKGEFSLVKMKGRGDHNWLLVKKQDEEATTDTYQAEDFALAGSSSSTPKKKSRKPTQKSSPVRKGDQVKAASAEIPTSKAKEKKETIQLSLNGREVVITSPSKFYWPDDGITKLDLVNYYQTMVPFLLPYLKDRPESLLRHPNGALQSGFFQKDAGDQAPDWVKTEAIQAESTGQEVSYLICQDAATLAYLNNLGCIQLNPWNSRRQNLQYPDFLVLDLDPGENTYDQVIETALVAREILDGLGIPVYPKTSGASGMHLYIPLGAKWPFEQVKELALRLARQIHARLPELTSLERSPKERRYQIYLDYLQNAIGQTIAAPYSVRPRPGAPVSAPLRWDEVKPGLSPAQFTLQNMPERVKALGDLFAPVLGKGINVEKYLQQLN